MGGTGQSEARASAQDAAEASGREGLSEDDRAVLDMESRRWRHRTHKERAIREGLGIEPIAYYLRLDGLLRDPRAHAEYPALLARLSLQVERDRLRPQSAESVSAPEDLQ